MIKFNAKEKRNLLMAVITVAILLVVDQWVKILAVNSLRGVPGHTFLNGFVVMEYAENRGAFLSLGASLSDDARMWVFVIGVLFILGFCIYSLFKSAADTASAFAFALVISGGVGNLIDRVRQGYVVDYIHMGFPRLRTGVFNVADVAISGGLLLLIFLQYRPAAKKAH